MRKNYKLNMARCTAAGDRALEEKRIPVAIRITFWGNLYSNKTTSTSTATASITSVFYFLWKKNDQRSLSQSWSTTRPKRRWILTPVRLISLSLKITSIFSEIIHLISLRRVWIVIRVAAYRRWAYSKKCQTITTLNPANQSFPYPQAK